jgi:hypothetical protein
MGEPGILCSSGRLLARPMIAALAVLPLVASAGCDGETRRFHDEGQICLFPAGTGSDGLATVASQTHSYRPDLPVDIAVLMPDCLSGTCSVDRKASCLVQVTGPFIQVSSYGSYRQNGTQCTLECGGLVATCTTPPLPAGTYEVRHGTTVLTLTVPSRVSAPCGGRRPF